jgi:HAD superfamily hydrolase (TIGR01490 family)
VDGSTGPRAAAFFDFDKTLLHGDAGVIFGMTLAEWGYEQGRHIKDPVKQAAHHARVTGTIVRMVGTGAAYRALHGIGLMKRSRLIELSYRFLAGFPAAEMSARMERVWNDRLHELLYPKMREVIEHHRRQGHRVVIVTTGMRELVEHSRKALGEDVHVVGVDMLQDEKGNWLGRVEGPLYGVHKAEAVRAYAHEHGIDLAQSYAYSDHYSDVAFLAAVGNPVAVNPQLRLALHARKKGWRVMRVLPPLGRGGVGPKPDEKEPR